MQPLLSNPSLRARVQRGRSRRTPSPAITFLLLAICVLFPLLFCAMPVRAETAHKESHSAGRDHAPAIGIDLGTTYSCAAVMKGGKVHIIPNGQGDRTTPSYVAFTPGGRLVGAAAKNQASLNPTNTVFDIKRVLGREFRDKSVKADLRHFPFHVTTKNEKPVIKVSTFAEEKPKYYSPEEISAYVLSSLKESAEAFIGKPVRHAVITVPAYFNDAQRSATRDAALIAGLEEVRIINEPTAAALAYGADRRSSEELNVVVFDLGGGTFDASLLAVDGGVFEVLATGGDTHLGGEDFDNRVIQHFIKLWNSRYPSDNVAENPKAMSRLRSEVEAAKRVLSSGPKSVQLEIEAFHKGRDFSETLTKAKFEDLNRDLFEITIETLKRVLKDGKVRLEEVDEIVLVGGSSRIPKVQEMLSKLFNGKKLNKEVNPDEAVAHGAAVHAAALYSPDDIEDAPLVLDVNPLTLGIETSGGVMAPLIPRNTVVPTRKSQVFTTTADNQESVNIRVFEGERSMTASNNLLGSLTLDGIPPAQRGVPQIEVTFQLDADGILQVTAADKVTGRTQKATITNDMNRLPRHEVERIIQEAQENVEVDRAFKKKAEARNKLESQIYALRDSLKEGSEFEKSLGKANRVVLAGVLQDTLDWLSEDDPSRTVEEYEERSELLREEMAAIASKNQGEDANDIIHEEL